MAYVLRNMKTKRNYTVEGPFGKAVETAEDMAKMMNAPVVVFELVERRVYTAVRPRESEGE